MAITYPLSWPSTLFPESITLTMVDVVGENRSPFTGESQVYEHQGKWWQCTVRMPPLNSRDGRDMLGFIASLKGKRGTVLLGDFTQSSPRGIGTGTPVVDTTGSPTPNLAREEVLAIRGFTTGQTGILLRGDMIQIGSGSSVRLHIVTEDADSDGSGNALVSVWPALREDIADGVAITLAYPVGLFRLAQNPRQVEIQNLESYGIELSFQEVL